LMQVHRAFDKALVRAAVTPVQRAQVHAQMRLAYPLAAAKMDGVEDVEARQLAALTDRQLFDASKFLAEVPTNAFDARVDGSFGLPAGLATTTKQAGADAAAWFADLYEVPPTAADNAWAPSQLEYQFA